MPRTNRPISVTLGELHHGIEGRVKSGAYASASEVMRAALRALDREEAAVDEWLRQRVDEAFADRRPNAPAQEGFKRLRSHPPPRLEGVDRDEGRDLGLVHPTSGNRRGRIDGRQRNAQ